MGLMGSQSSLSMPDGAENDSRRSEGTSELAPPNTPPVEVANTGISLEEGATVTITSSHLEFVDAEQDDRKVTFTLNSIPEFGLLFKKGKPMKVSDKFHQKEINDGKITYEHDGSETTSVSFQFDVSDGEGGEVTDVVFRINIEPVNDNPPVIDVSQVFTISENVGNSYSLGEIVVSDADPGTTFSNWIFTAGNEESIFKLHPDTGEITIWDSTSLDYETTPEYQLFATVSDGLNTSSEESIIIQLTDINDNTPVITPNQSFEVAEDESNEVIIGTITSTDVDEETTFSNWTIVSDSEIFALNSSSGELMLSEGANLDFETLQQYELSITVYDGINTSAAETITINVNDVNDNAPVITPSQSFSIDEDAPNEHIVGTIEVLDDDSDTEFSGWLIISGNEEGVFSINSVGELTIADSSSLDFESTSSFTLTLTVSDGANTSTEEDIEIHVDDVNDNAPIITASQTFTVEENAANDTSIGTVMASDADTNSSFSGWEIHAGNDDGVFALNPTNGELTVADNANLDREATDSYTLSLTVSDGTNTSEPEDVVVNVNDFTAKLTIEDVSINEDDGSVSIAVMLDVAVFGGLTVDVSTANGTATTEDGDYTEVIEQSVSFLGYSGETHEFTISLGEDNKVEPDETFTIGMSNVSGIFVSANDVDVSDQATVSIVNDDNASLTIEDASAAENEEGATLLVSLDNPVSGGFTVDVSTVDGLATAEEGDYSMISKMLTFSGSAGEELSLIVQFNNDSIVEPDETLYIALSNLSGTSLEMDISDEAEVTIINDDIATVTIADVSGDESDGEITMQATLDREVLGGFEVDVVTYAESAMEDDFESIVKETLTFAGAAREAQTFSISIVDDEEVETTETFGVHFDQLKVDVVSPEFINITDSAKVTIRDNDAVIIDVGDVSVTEGDSGSRILNFTVSLGSSASETISVDFETSEGTATAGSDFTTKAGTLSFSPGESIKSVSVSIFGDQRVEGDETLILNLRNNTGASTISDGTATGVIANDDFATVQIADVTTDEATANITLTAVLDNYVEGGFSVDLRTTDGTAIKHLDYTPLNAQTLSFEGSLGERKSFEIEVKDDNMEESNETFTVIMENLIAGTISPGAIDITSEAMITILDDDEGSNEVQISIADATAAEDAGTITFDISLSDVSDTEVTVEYAIENGTATAEVDYSPDSGTITFEPGETIKSLEISVLDDEIVENEETFNLTLSNNTGESSIAKPSATGTITDQDQATVFIDDVSGEEDESSLSFTVTLDKEVDGGLTIDLSTKNSDATDGTDYTTISETITFTGSAGETHTFTVQLIDDTEVEPNETFTVFMDNLSTKVSSAAIDISDQAIGTIIDNDRAQVIVSSVSGHEDSGDLSVTLTLNRAVFGGFILSASTQDATAVAGEDYEAIDSEVFIFFGFEGEQKTLVVTPIDDQVDEDEETLSVVISSIGGINQNVDISNVGKITILDDDHTPEITENQVFEIAESVENGADIGTIDASDEDAGTTLVNWTVISGNEDGIFSLDPNTGFLSVQDNSGLVANSQYSLEVSVSDGANTSSVVTVAIRVIDVRVPTVTISSDVGEITNSAEVTIFADFTEEVSGFISDEVSVSNGEVTSLETTNKQNYSFKVAPVLDGYVSVLIPEGVAVDKGGNGNSESNELSYFYDGSKPTATLKVGEIRTDPNPLVTVFVDFSEPVTGLSESDFNLSSGSVSSLSGSMDAYTLEVADISGEQATITLMANAVMDQAGNQNTAVSLAINADVTGPTEFMPSFVDQIVNALNETSIAFQIQNIEQGATYEYRIHAQKSDEQLTGSGVAMNEPTYEENLDLSDFPDGVIELSVTMTDEFGNEGATKTDQINKNTALSIPQGISPDGDGANDTWVIPGIEKYPDNHVVVFNRWGNVVYEVKGYDNGSKVFAGISNNNIEWGGKMPEGTYYYVIELSAEMVEKGYLVISK